jgi:hypothetical protein
MIFALASSITPTMIASPSIVLNVIAMVFCIFVIMMKIFLG